MRRLVVLTAVGVFATNLYTAYVLVRLPGAGLNPGSPPVGDPGGEGVRAVRGVRRNTKSTSRAVTDGAVMSLTSGR